MSLTCPVEYESSYIKQKVISEIDYANLGL